MNFDKNSKSTKIAKVVALIFVLYLVVDHFNKPKAPPIPIPVVTIQKPIEAEVVDYVTQTGTTVAYNSVDLVARVEGYLDSIKFTDGVFVKKNQELFIIQPEPYMEQLKEAQATVAAKKATNAYSKSEYARQQRMYKENATSLNNVEKWLAQTQQSEADVDEAVANERIAAINYGYTHISAPFDGRIGRHQVDAGNLVGNGVATILATIDQIDPMYVYFNLNEIDLIKLRAAAKARGVDAANINQIPVDVSLQNDPKLHKATLDFVNTGLNASTGTMELRAVLKNKDYLFVPGLFVQVRVATTLPKKQLTVPDTAILYDQIGSYLLTVDKENVVVSKRVEIGSLNDGMRAVTKGINAQDEIIIGGLQNATPGKKVEPHKQVGSQQNDF